MRTREHDRDCDVVVWQRGSTHEFVWTQDFLRQRCVNALRGITDQDVRNDIIVGLRTMDAFGYGAELEYSQEQRDAFAAILLAGEVQRAYWFAGTCAAPTAGERWFLALRPCER